MGYDTQISKLKEEYNRYYSLKASLGDDLKEGLISKEEFDDFRESYGRKCEELEQMIENQKKLVKQMFEDGVSATVQFGGLEEITGNQRTGSHIAGTDRR